MRHDKIAHKFNTVAPFSRYMAPIAVLTKPTSTTTALNTATNNNLSAYIANTSVVILAFFSRVPGHRIWKQRASDPLDHFPGYQCRTFHRKAMIVILSSHSFSLLFLPFPLVICQRQFYCILVFPLIRRHLTQNVLCIRVLNVLMLSFEKCRC